MESLCARRDVGTRVRATLLSKPAAWDTHAYFTGPLLAWFNAEQWIDLHYASRTSRAPVRCADVLEMEA